MNRRKINRTTLFLVLTFMISFSLAGIFVLTGGDRSDSIGFTLLGAAYMFVPMIAAVIAKKFIYHERLTDLFISFKINKWFFVA